MNLQLLIDEGNVEKLKEVINNPDNNGNYPLHLAIVGKKTEVALDFISFDGININACNESGETPLICAVLHGNQEVVKKLIPINSLDINHYDKSGKTALLHAAEKKDVNFCNLLLTNPRIDIMFGVSKPNDPNKIFLDFLAEDKGEPLKQLSAESVKTIKSFFPKFNPDSPSLWVYNRFPVVVLFSKFQQSFTSAFAIENLGEDGMTIPIHLNKEEMCHILYHKIQLSKEIQASGS